ncbi:hypothetical protein [Saccharopolyspora spinosa]|uniref:Uncharacterized protein n=1 Tax=Saccharopolyspora spinosa TaxID=60894 RepID=A0A2N3Y257_SACSN|nr:hypothetical protein [Saccharopolyspora spinosa]PKW16982.1 hypothetical protein A8926_4897 [Saccharopolyspora spinosa]
MHLQVLPLAITMMAGPQIMSAIVFATKSRAVRVSVASSPAWSWRRPAAC